MKYDYDDEDIIIFTNMIVTPGAFRDEFEVRIDGKTNNTKNYMAIWDINIKWLDEQRVWLKKGVIMATKRDNFVDPHPFRRATGMEIFIFRRTFESWKK